MYTVLYVSIKLRNQVIRDVCVCVNHSFYFPFLVSILTRQDAVVMEGLFESFRLFLYLRNLNGSRFGCGSTHLRITMAGSLI